MKKVKIFRITAYVTDEIKKLLQMIADKTNISKSQIIANALIDSAIARDVNNGAADPDYSAVKERQIRKEAKTLGLQLYFDFNYYRRIINSAQASIIMIGQINKQEIDILIDKANEVYTALPKHIKAIKRESILEINLLRKEEILTKVVQDKSFLLNKKKVSFKKVLEIEDRRKRYDEQPTNNRNPKKRIKKKTKVRQNANQKTRQSNTYPEMAVK